MYKIKFSSKEDNQDFIDSCLSIRKCVEESLKKYLSSPFKTFNYEHLKCDSIEFYINNFTDTGIRVYISGSFETDYDLHKYVSEYLKKHLRVHVDVITDL